MACSTLYQCFNFLARHNGVISLAPHPDDPCKTRCALRICGAEDDVLVAIEYDCTQEIDLLTKAIIPVCRALQEQVEK